MVVPYAEMVKKLKPSKNGQKTFMCLNKSVASIVESLSTSLKDDHHLLACLSKVNNKNPEELNKVIFNFNFNDDLGADTSFYFLYLMLKAGYPVSYEWDKNTIMVMLVIGKKKESEFSKQTNFPGFKEESNDGTAYCSGEPCPPLRRVYKDTLCLFFPSDIQEAIRDKYLTYIRDFIVHRFTMQD